MKKDTCYYDGRCGLCRRSKRTLERLDWLGTLYFEDLTQVSQVNPPVPLDAILVGMPMRTHDGRVLIGYPAVRRALLRTPAGFLPALLLYVPGISWVGRQVYRWIAANRNRDAVCAIQPLEKTG